MRGSCPSAGPVQALVRPRAPGGVRRPPAPLRMGHARLPAGWELDPGAGVAGVTRPARGEHRLPGLRLRRVRGFLRAKGGEPSGRGLLSAGSPDPCSPGDGRPGPAPRRTNPRDVAPRTPRLVRHAGARFHAVHGGSPCPCREPKRGRRRGRLGAAGNVGPAGWHGVDVRAGGAGGGLALLHHRRCGRDHCGASLPGVARPSQRTLAGYPVLRLEPLHLSGRDQSFHDVGLRVPAVAAASHPQRVAAVHSPQRRGAATALSLAAPGIDRVRGARRSSACSMPG